MKMAKPTIRELEKILDAEEDTPIEILPNGEVRAQGQGSKERPLLLIDSTSLLNKQNDHPNSLF